MRAFVAVCIKALMILLCLLIRTTWSKSAIYLIQVTQQPSRCIGGEVCLVQPQLAVFKDGQIDLTFNGVVYVNMAASPSGGEPLWLGTCDINNFCGMRISGSLGTVGFANGIAKFQNLMIQTAGSGYTLRFTLKNADGNDIAFTFSSTFEVSPGDVFKMFIIQQVGSATGGAPFSPNPVIALTDRGSNTLDINYGTVTAYIQDSPSASTQLRPASALVVPIVHGVAAFDGLFINEAGGPYRIRFSGSITIKGVQVPYVYSTSFFVAIGSPAQLVFVDGTRISDDPVYAGEYFRSVPRILILDAGGNQVIRDQTSAIQVTIADNPSKATIGEPNSLFPVASGGAVAFSALKIDKAGRSFRLAFTLNIFSQLTSAYTTTNIVLYSASFDVNVGPARDLFQVTLADVAWAGGLPMEVQPVLQLRDFGGNILVEDFSTTVRCEMIPSLSVTSSIGVDATKNDNTFVNLVTTTLHPNWDDEFGAGAVIDITLHFAYEVWLTYPNPSVPPRLQLTVRNNGVRAVAVLDTTQNMARVNQLTFVYTVASGDVSDVGHPHLDIYSPLSDYTGVIDLSNGLLKNGNNRDVSRLVPTDNARSLGVANIKVDTSVPIAWNMTCATTSGEYGVGEVIEFFVRFSKPVVAVGEPFLELTARVSSGGYAHAAFNRTIADTDGRNTVLVFKYVVEPGDSEPGMLTLKTNSILYPDANSYIRRSSDTPVTDVSVALTDSLSGTPFSTLFIASSQIRIDTTIPRLDLTYGIISDAAHITGPLTLYPGDSFPVYLKFTKPVIIMDTSVALSFRCGTFNFPAVFKSLDIDEKTLEFTFTVPMGADTTHLDIISGAHALLIPGQEAFIKRKASIPTQNVDASTLAIYSSNSKSFKHYTTMILKGWSPTIQSITLRSTSVPPPLRPDDFALIDVTFDLPIQMSCNPVFIIQLSGAPPNSKSLREATYDSGNGGNVITFKYKVSFGDESPGLQYRYAPEPFCYKSGCVKDTCTIFTTSAAPQMEALTVVPPATSLTMYGGVYISQSVSILPTQLTPRATTIVGITARVASAAGSFGNYASSAGEYGAGTSVNFDVQFSDEVIFPFNSQQIPMLNLNIGGADRKNATLLSGAGTKVLTFYYSTMPGDDIASLLPENLSPSLSPVVCITWRGCVILNRVSIPVVLTPAPIIDAQIRIDTTPPYITKVWTYKNTSTYNNIYTIGETINIHVRWSKDILVTGKTPRLLMDVTAPEGYALWNTALTSALPNSKREFVLTYTVRPNDMAKNLTYIGPNLDQMYGLTRIYRASDQPMTEAVYVLPNALAPLPISDQANFQFVIIDTSVTPYITGLEFITPPGLYVAGDVIIFKVLFSIHVVLTGRATIAMNMGNHITNAIYIGDDESTYSASITALLPSKATRTFFFKVEVAEYDFNPRLDYTDAFAFSINNNDLGGAGSLRQASTTPTKPAIIDLPKPGSPESLSDPKLGAFVFVNGDTPRMTDLRFLNPDGIYGAGTRLQIAMDFSIKVVVSGVPYIVLNMVEGNSYRKAMYASGSGSTRLLYEYVVQPGDSQLSVDYLLDRRQFRSASLSFQYNGATIKAAAMVPSTDAFLYLNPPGGSLRGTSVVPASAGIFRYLDVSIPQYGNDYLIRFLSAPSGASRTLTSWQIVFVSFTNEFELLPNEAQKHDLIGHDVALKSNFAAIGAPASNLSVNTIQTITTKAQDPFLVPLPCIQIVGTQVERQPFIESFHTTGAVGSVVGGTFRIYHANHPYIGGPDSGKTRPILVDVLPSSLVTILSEDLPHLGRITATREAYIFCACENAYTWTLTFHDLTAGIIPSMKFDISGLLGSSNIGDNKRIQEAAYVGGKFRLNVFGKQTGDIPYDASAADIERSLLAIGVKTIDVRMNEVAENPARERFWYITFEHHDYSYDIPLMTSTYTNDVLGLTGNKARIYHQMVRKGIHGPGGFNGGFKLVWRGNTTHFIPYNASAHMMKTALEGLPIINFVNVNRSDPTSLNGFTWTVEFVDVNWNTPRGYERAVVANLEPMTVVNEMIGTNIDVHIGSRYYLNDELSLHKNARAGTFGKDSGAVYLFEQSGSTWKQVGTLRGNDTSPADQFGSSVSLDSYSEGGKIVVVGAVGADMNGVFAKQAIMCTADAGTFKLSFRSSTTKDIPYDVTKAELQNIISSDSNFFFSGLYSVLGVDIDDWGSGTSKNINLCDNNTAIITFRAPLNKIDPITGAVTFVGDIEPLVATSSLTLGGSGSQARLSVFEVRKGTIRAYGTDADLQQHGAAYIFRSTCDPALPQCLERNWNQEAQLFPTPVRGEASNRFGYSTAFYKDVVAVGAPGGATGRGHVYVYEGYYVAIGGNGVMQWRWSMLQRILIQATVPGDEFGYALDLHDNTLVMSAPYMNGKGAVFVYKRNVKGESFAIAQQLVPNMIDYPLQAGDMYGRSVVVNDRYVVISAPGRDAATIYMGTVPNLPDKDTGAVFVFYRETPNDVFQFMQALTPTNVRREDRFGWSVDMHGTTIVASSWQHSDNALNASRAIIEVKTVADYNALPLGETFALLWKTYNTTGAYVPTRTRQIPHDVSAVDMEQILQNDLGCGDVIVSRSNKDVYNNGYSWMITFLGQKQDVPLFQADSTLLTGTGARVDIGYVNTFPPAVRGATHIFERSRTQHVYNPLGDFVEEMFASPFAHQPIDRCGSSVSVSNGYVLVGCPNRDGYIPNKNSGSASLFSLNFLNIQFDARTYTVDEGLTQPLIVLPRDPSPSYQLPSDTLFIVETVDRNAASRRQTFLRDFFGLTQVPADLTPADLTANSGTAVGRSQFYGSKRRDSRWAGGMYDYRGISDYVPLLNSEAYLVEYLNVTVPLVTTADSLLELPNENLTVALYSPGVWPSPLGNLYSKITILDNGDGITNNAFRYGKVYESDGIAGSKIGQSVAVHEKTNYMVTGSPDGFRVTPDPRGGPPFILQCGIAVVFKKVGAQYVEEQKLFSPNPVKNNRFGDSVTMSTAYMTGTALLAIGEPNAAKVYVWYYDSTQWSFETTLTAPEATTTNHRFGARGTIGVDRNLLVVGAPGLEAIFIYIRSISNGVWSWSASSMMRSSEYDYDIIFSVYSPHRQEFGAAVAVSGRMIAVGSPRADYANTGTKLVEFDVNTEGIDIMHYGRGKVYTYYSSPAIESLTISAPSQLTAGSWALSFTGSDMTTTTTMFSYSAAALTVQTALAALPNINEVRVSSSSQYLAGIYYYSWTITFLSEFAAPAGNLVPLWFGYGCNLCTPFSVLTPDPSLQIVMGDSVVMSSIREQQILSASDKDLGSRFGSAIAIHNDQLVVSAVMAAGSSMTDWTFETGLLTGWSRTGTAFEYQPTFGDNTYLRPIYTPVDQTTGIRATPESSNLRGRYYIATYEQRPGTSTNFEVSDPNFYQAQVQGDGPQGTLSSNVFMIYGDRISFLIGGGCRIESIYVELVVDGLSVARQTGKCREKMEEAHFDTGLYIGRAGQINIVDASSVIWGHINVDHFEFNWDIFGRRMPTASGATVGTGKIDTPHAGAVYAFHLTAPNSINFCSTSKFDCIWSEEARFVASDKRENIMFGYSVDVNDDSGVIVVGAPAAAMTGFYKEAPAPYPFLDKLGASTKVTAVPMPLPGHFMIAMESAPKMGPLANGAKGIWYEQYLSGEIYSSAKDLNDTSYANANTGAVYVFKKDHAVLAGSGDVSVAQHWYVTETAKVQGTDGKAMDSFGTSVALDGNLLAIGSVGNDGLQPDAGAIYLYEAGFAAAFFSDQEYQGLEGTHADVSIYVSRNPDIYAGELVLEYATSDLTAKGVDSVQFENCMAMAASLRGLNNCGDYEQTVGVLTIPQGSNTAGFKIRIMNDLCHERYLKYLQITLSVPGGGSLQSNALSARLRIDDDDFLLQTCDWSE